MHELSTSIELQMSLLLLFALLGYLLSSRIGQPAVVGQIILGIIVGPSLLGWITYTTFVSNIAHLGAIILLFVIGFEFKLKEIAQIRNIVIGIFGVIVPWIGGYWLATAFGFEFGKAILLGVVLTATSIAITADTLREMGKLNSEAAKVIIGAAVVDDILALLVLTVAKQLSLGTLSWAATSLFVTKAVLFLGIGIGFGHLFLIKIVARLDESNLAKKYPELVFIFSLMVAFAYAISAELMGLSAIVGAFVAGVSLEGIKLKNSIHFKEGAEYLRIVFGAVFFISLGIMADLKSFDMTMIWFALALTVVAILTKVVGCTIPARTFGMNWRDSLTIGFGMAPRGEIAMIIALIALNEKVIEQPAYVAIVAMSLLTTLLVPLILRNCIYKQ